jgi:predicted tellurium resistance membrane protein TerC
MGVAATAIANLLHKHRWIGFIGLAIVLYVAVHMIWEGHRSVVIDLHKTDTYNAAAPSFLDIKPDEVAAHNKHKK